MSKKLSLKSGFTLIELLVVIAIIGILASVVLVSLRDARNNGFNAKIKAELAGMRSEAELQFESDSGSFDGVCTSGNGPQVIYASAAASGAGGSGNATECNDTASAWAAWVDLRGGDYYCVDSTGASSELTTAPTTGATVCP